MRSVLGPKAIRRLTEQTRLTIVRATCRGNSAHRVVALVQEAGGMLATYHIERRGRKVIALTKAEEGDTL